jgi:ParB-like chromosome segregation protein Spo0J
MKVEFHQLANAFPLMEGVAFDELVTDIETNGVIEPIVFHEGKILDGRNRYRALEHLGRVDDVIRFSEEFAGPDPIAFVISKNLKRRHLDESQRAMVAARLATLKQGTRTDLAEISAMSQPEAAAALNVSRGSVQNASKVLDHGAPELADAVDRGDVSVSAAALLATEPLERQRELVASCDEDVVLAAARQIRADKRTAPKTTPRFILLPSRSLFLPIRRDNSCICGYRG